MRISFVLLLFCTWQAKAQEFIQVKTPHAYYIIGALDSSFVHACMENGNESIYVESNGFTKNILCSGCESVYFFEGKYFFSIITGKHRPKKAEVTMGMMDLDGYKTSAETFEVGKRVWFTRKENPMCVLFTDI